METGVLDVAAYVLKRRGAMSAMKLQKMVYYCQAWSLALRDQSLFGEPIEAWAYGPVVHRLFAQHKGHYIVSQVDGDASKFRSDPETINLLDKVCAYYGLMSGNQLSTLSHQEEPWRAARECSDGWGDVIIPHASMKTFYRQQQQSAQRPDPSDAHGGHYAKWAPINVVIWPC